jgi:hypothetical protein
MSITMTFGFNKSAGSSNVAILLHGLMNVGFGVILNEFLGKAKIREVLNQHDILWMTFLGVAFLLSAVTRGQLGINGSRREVDLQRDAMGG